MKIRLLLFICFTEVLAAVGAVPGARVRNRAFRDEPLLKLQIFLDRQGFSPNCIDGRWGRKTAVALATYRTVNAITNTFADKQDEVAFLLRGESALFTTVTVTEADRAALTHIPARPEEKAALTRMGYETLCEMYAERGHLTERALERLNPSVAWPNPPAGTRLLIPSFPDDDPVRLADVLRVSLSRFEITAFDASGRMIALFPCSIAAKRSKRPPPGEILVTSSLRNPDYTYTPDFVSKGQSPSRYVFKPGPNNPVGIAWMGLSLPGYGIHGTPAPEQIGCAASHGCFRLANWNAERLRRMCDPGTSIVIEN